VKNKILPITAVLVMVWGGVAMRDSLAQTASEKPVQHEDMDSHPGHHTGSPSDGAFHHRFEDADKWAKEFDNPERDAWQKPEEVLDALHLKRTSIVADIGAGTGYFSVGSPSAFPKAKYLPPMSSRTWCVTLASERNVSI